VVLATAVVAVVFYGTVRDLSWGGRFSWWPVAEGALIAAAVLLTWTSARSRRAAAIGLAVAPLIGLLLGTFVVDPSFLLHLPLLWAVLVPLAVRVLVPATADAATRLPERTTT
jgi:peptidoglycan/LPS O-acetylase OafA/YrhL